MKGQFMLISSIVIGIIILTTAGSISKITSQKFESDTARYDINTVRSLADKLDLSKAEDREKFRRTLDLMDSYSIETSYWSSHSCVNVTMRRVGDELHLGCLS